MSENSSSSANSTGPADSAGSAGPEVTFGNLGSFMDQGQPVAQSPLSVNLSNIMREGMRPFTQYTDRVAGASGAEKAIHLYNLMSQLPGALSTIPFSMGASGLADLATGGQFSRSAQGARDLAANTRTAQQAGMVGPAEPLPNLPNLFNGTQADPLQLGMDPWTRFLIEMRRRRQPQTLTLR